VAVDFLTLSATTLARMIRDREATSSEIVEAHVARVRRVNPGLNAVVCARFEEARREAAIADAKVEAGEPLPPLHGVPCTIKECFALVGMPNSSGLRSRAGVVADRDATAVARLRAAGAIPLGVTNVSELCMWMETSNLVYGRTNNPYDRRRIVGGSSGGEGAIVGSGASPFGLGSDIGGSIRMPAFFCGVFGHKPSGGLVPGTGQYPMAHGRARRYLTTGPIARRAEDLWPLLRILAGPDGEDDGCTSLPLGAPSRVQLRGLDVVSVEDNGALQVDRRLVSAQRRAADALAARGARVRTASIEPLRHSLEVWSTLLAEAGGPTFAELMGDGVAIDAFAELFRWLRGRADHTLPAIGLALLEKLPALMPARAKQALAHAERLRDELDATIGDGVMLFPSYTCPAPLHHTPLLLPIQWQYTAVLNVLELPATQVPLGLDEKARPLGIQVVARHGGDHLTIAIAQSLERDLGGWVPPWRAPRPFTIPGARSHA
jgi:fatty acid amide hydrolase 2